MPHAHIRQAQLRCAIVGLGRHGAKEMIPAIGRAQNASLVAVFDIEPTRNAECSASLGLPTYRTLEDMLNREQPDFCIVETPHFTHYGIVEAIARHGIHVLKEKPLALNLAEGVRLQRLCQATNVTIGVVAQKRYTPSYHALRRVLEGVGKPWYVSMVYRLAIGQEDQGWRSNREEAGGGCILDMGYHFVDLVTWLLGVPDEVFSAPLLQSGETTENGAAVTFKYMNTHVQGSLLLSRFSPGKDESITVHGTDSVVYVSRDSLHIFGAAGNQIERLEFVGPSDLLARQIDSFCESLTGTSGIDKANEGELEQHLSNMAFIEACYQSASSLLPANPKEILHNQVAATAS